MPLPDSQFVSEDERADLKEWVLTVSMDQSVDQVLDTDSRGVFVASLLDSKTGQTSKPCILTGYPVLGQGVELNDGKVGWSKGSLRTLELNQGCLPAGA